MTAPRYHICKLHGKDPASIAEKIRADSGLRAEVLNEISVLEERNRGGRIIDRCVVSKEYRDLLIAALGLADAPRPTPPA
jgi:hypothetical protein